MNMLGKVALTSEQKPQIWLMFLRAEPAQREVALPCTFSIRA